MRGLALALALLLTYAVTPRAARANAVAFTQEAGAGSNQRNGLVAARNAAYGGSLDLTFDTARAARPRRALEAALELSAGWTRYSTEQSLADVGRCAGTGGAPAC